MHSLNDVWTPFCRSQKAKEKKILFESADEVEKKLKLMSVRERDIFFFRFSNRQRLHCIALISLIFTLKSMSNTLYTL